MNKKVLEDLVLNGNFSEAYEMINEMTIKEVLEKLVRVSFATNNLIVYGFVAYCLYKNEHPIYHSLAIDLLTTSYLGEESTIKLAYFHAKRSVEFDSNSIISILNLKGILQRPEIEFSYEEDELVSGKLKEKLEKYKEENSSIEVSEVDFEKRSIEIIHNSKIKEILKCDIF